MKAKIGFILGVACAALLLAAFTMISRDRTPRATVAAEPVFARMPLEEMKQRFDRGELTVIDVRDIDAYGASHIPGALQIPLSRIEGEIPYLPKDKTIVAYCTCPNEESSGEAVRILAHGGITNAVALAGGLGAWQKAGYRTDAGIK